MGCHRSGDGLTLRVLHRKICCSQQEQRQTPRRDESTAGVLSPAKQGIQDISALQTPSREVLPIQQLLNCADEQRNPCVGFLLNLTGRGVELLQRRPQRRSKHVTTSVLESLGCEEDIMRWELNRQVDALGQHWILEREIIPEGEAIMKERRT